MESIGKDLIRYIALKLDLESIEKLCQTSQRFLEICNSDSFWRAKLIKDFPMIEITRVKDLKGLYKYLLSKPKVEEIDYPTTVREFNELVRDLTRSKKLKKGDVIKGMGINKVLGVSYVFKEKFYSDVEISFPEFPPHYYVRSEGTHFQNIIDAEIGVPYEEIEDFDKPYIEGKFGERYKKKFIQTDDDEDPYGVFENYELVVYV